MKILFLARLYHPHIGGVEKHILEISKILRKKGHEVSVITEQFDNSLSIFEKNDNVSIYRIPIGRGTFFKKFYIWKWMLMNFSLLLKSDVIHVHDVFYWLYPILFIKFFKKIFITFHGYEGYPIKMRWIIARKLAELLTNGDICVGDFMKKWYHTKPNYVIYGGVNVQKIEGNPPPFSALFFGRLDDQTGILEYIKAYKLLKKKYPKFKLTVIGEGPLSSRIPKEIKLLPFRDDISYYLAKNRFIFVSRYLSILEALAQNRIVIAVYDNPVKKDYLLLSPFKKFIIIKKSSSEVFSEMDAILSSGSNQIEQNKGLEFAKTQSWIRVFNTYINLWQGMKS